MTVGHVIGGAIWLGVIIAAAFFVGRLSVATPTPAELTVAAALEAIVDEGLITVEEHAALWREYATKVRAA